MDIGAMAERMSSAVSNATSAAADQPTSSESTPATPPATSSPAPSATPSAAPLSTTAPSTATPTPTTAPDLSFTDDPPDIDFDAPPPTDPAQNDLTATPAPAVPEPTPSEFAGMLPKAVEDAFLRTQRGRNMLSAFKSDRSLRESPNFDPVTGENLGGLGFSPTPEQIKDYHARASDWDAAQHEFSANPQSWAINHFGLTPEGTFREGAQQVLASLPSVINSAYDRAVQTGDRQLEEQSVAAFKAVFQPMALEYINGLYDRARNIADPAQREQYLNGARTIEFDLTGKYRGDDQLAPPKPEDGLRQREQALADRERNVMAWQQRSQSEAAVAARNQVFADIDAALTADIERAFSTSNLKSTMKPFAYKAAIDAYKTQIQQAVRQNQFAFRQYNFALSKVGSSGNGRSAEARAEAIKAYRQAGQTAIRNSYRNILQELVDGTVSQNATARSTAASAASQSAPSVNGGQPPAQSVVSESRVTRTPGEDRSDYIHRRLAASLGTRAS